MLGGKASPQPKTPGSLLKLLKLLKYFKSLGFVRIVGDLKMLILNVRLSLELYLNVDHNSKGLFALFLD